MSTRWPVAKFMANWWSASSSLRTALWKKQKIKIGESSSSSSSRSELFEDDGDVVSTDSVTTASLRCSSGNNVVIFLFCRYVQKVSFRSVFVRMRRAEGREAEVFVWCGCKINLFFYYFEFLNFNLLAKLMTICNIYIVDLVPRGEVLPRGCWCKQRAVQVLKWERRWRGHVRREFWING